MEINIKIEPWPYEKNVVEVIHTFFLGKNENNRTLPFLDRLLTILPELEPEIKKECTPESIEKVISDKLRRRYKEEMIGMIESLNNKKDLSSIRIIPAVKEMLHLFQLENMDFDILCYLGFIIHFQEICLQKIIVFIIKYRMIWRNT